MTKNLPLFVLMATLLVSGCASKHKVDPAHEGTMVNSEFHDYISEDRINNLAAGYLKSGKAKDSREAHELAAADLFAEEAQKRAAEEIARAETEREAKRQAPIQKALREVDLKNEASY
jgi:uncharacterized protein YceK